ncbi:osmoprotectant transport system permease protein [Actinacidiphila yanglinensis]|uniref:Osmoprotectant transport system permease protein n=1 Tax=Actinacidiphila yanglinensis TaxID=310779 RepID=A0A1H5VNU1_9ACTN|nr:ABC transporter permease subunit [Actinacidiphila yanglinensis]SEF88568.1 osmoprotectant transport system permease protein [Actinacidiphila yanglinensis]
MNLFHYISDFLTDSSHWHGYDGIPHRLDQHLGYSFEALAIAAAIALPIGLVSGHTGRGGNALAVVATAGRALPSYGLLVLMFFWIGRIGLLPVMIPLVALAVPPILVTSYEAMRTVDPAPVDAARGMGMGPAAVLFQVELPVALPLILSGMRSAAIQVVSTAAIAATVSLGGLGRYIVDGYYQRNYETVAGGGALIALLALAMVGVFWILERVVVSPGVRRSN